MHLSERKRRITGTGGKDKAIVFGALERGGKVVANIINDRKKERIHIQVKSHVKAGSALYSDALRSYDGLAQYYAHEVIDHAEKYVDGKVHTNGLENFWSLLKRGISGTYVSVEPFHLFRYLDEQVFRYNNRNTKKFTFTDSDRFNLTLSKITGKRLTFANLTGKGGTTYAC
jgi:transposase-like protein